MREDGTMMRTAELAKLAERFQIKFITIRDLQEYRKCHDKLVDQVTAVNPWCRDSRFYQPLRLCVQ